MNKLKTFLIYVLIILGFFGVSEFLSGRLIDQMYYKIKGTVEEVFNYEGQELALKVEVLEAKATNVNRIYQSKSYK